MTIPENECSHGRGDEVARYLRGRMAQAEADAFEAHYFACQTCATELSLAMRVRAAGRTVKPLEAQRAKRWPGLLVAASLAILIGVVAIERRDETPAQYRSSGDAPITIQVNRSSVQWSRVAGATRYVIETFAADGARLESHTVPATTERIDLSTPATHVRIRAENEEGTLATSALHPL